MCDGYSCIFYLIPTKFAQKTLLKQANIPFLALDFPKQNGAGYKLLNVITFSQCYNRAQCFPEQKHQRNDQSDP